MGGGWGIRWRAPTRATIAFLLFSIMRLEVRYLRSLIYTLLRRCRSIFISLEAPSRLLRSFSIFHIDAYKPWVLFIPFYSSFSYCVYHPLTRALTTLVYSYASRELREHYFIAHKTTPACRICFAYRAFFLPVRRKVRKNTHFRSLRLAYRLCLFVDQSRAWNILSSVYIVIGLEIIIN